MTFMSKLQRHECGVIAGTGGGSCTAAYWRHGAKCEFMLNGSEQNLMAVDGVPLDRMWEEAGTLDLSWSDLT